MVIKKAILFDLDNTLYNYDKPNEKALKAVFKVISKKINISFSKFETLYKISKAEINKELAGSASSHNRVLYFQRLVEKTHNTIDPSTVLKLYSAYWDTLLANMKLGTGVIKTLKELKESGIKIGIVTGLTAHIQFRKVHKFGIGKYVDILVTSEEAGIEKPNSTIFLLALNKLNISPSEAIMVGDNIINDIGGANSVGIDTILIEGGSTRKSKRNYPKPNFTIKNIPEVLNILKDLNN